MSSYDDLIIYIKSLERRLAALERLEGGDTTGLLSKAQFADIYRQGFLNQTETTIAFNGTNLFTLAAVGATWSYYRAGTKYTVSGNRTVTIPGSPIATGHWHIYIDAVDGTLTASQTDWTLLDTKVPVATVQFNNALTPKYWLSDERHTILIDSRMQYLIHATEGAKLVTPPVLTGWTANSDVDTSKTFAISSSVLVDQDIYMDVAALSDPNGTATDYVVWYRTSSTAWAWAASAMPFPYSATYIQYDNGGTLTTGQNNKFYNSYLLVTNIQGASRHIIIPGRSEFSTLADAQAEAVSAFTWGMFDVDEAVICYRLTWSTSSSHSSKGKCVLAASPQLINVSTGSSVPSTAGIDHGGLAGLLDDDHTQYLLASAAGSRTTFATNWTDLTDAGATTLHKHDHGGQDGLADDDHTQYLLATGARTGATSQAQAFTGDVLPLAILYGVGNRLLNKNKTPDTHFASASIPTNYAWAGSPFDGTPSSLSYNILSDYMRAVAVTSGGRVFMYRSITNSAAAWQGKGLFGRFRTGTTTEMGLRVDDGTDNNYAEVYTTGALANGTQRLDFRYRSGGGSVTTVNSALIIPCSDFMSLQLMCTYSGGNYSFGGYLLSEDGSPINITSFGTGTVTWSPAAGRAGILVKQNNGNYAYCDWLANEFG